MDTDTLLGQFAKRVQHWSDFFGLTTADMQFAVAYRTDVEREAPVVTYQRKITTFTLGPKALEWNDKNTDIVAFTCVFTVFVTVVNGYGLASFTGEKYKDSDEYERSNKRYVELRHRLLRIMQVFVWPIIASGQADAMVAELNEEWDDEAAGSD